MHLICNRSIRKAERPPNSLKTIKRRTSMETACGEEGALGKKKDLARELNNDPARRECQAHGEEIVRY